MDLYVKSVLTHPKAGYSSSKVEFEFSTRTARLVLAGGDLLVDHDTSTNAVRSSIRTSGLVEKLVYVGGSATFLVFTENGRVASYTEGLNSLSLVQEREISDAERPVTFVAGSRGGHYAVFCKSESSNLWCLPVTEAGALQAPYKLRSDIEGDQGNVNFVGGVVAKVRGKVATKPKSRSCPIVAITTHDSLPIASAAYENGIIRVWDLERKEQRSHFDAQLLIAETFVDIAMHPFNPVVVACTTQGRIMTFYAKNIPFKRGNVPLLASSKTRDRNRRYQAMCFLPGNPSYLLLLTASRRVVVRIIEKGSIIVNSGRFQKASGPLELRSSSTSASVASDMPSIEVQAVQDEVRFNKITCEPAFGLMAASTEGSGDVVVLQNRANSLPEIRGPVCCGLDTAISEGQGSVWQGSALIAADSIIAFNGVLFSYALCNETTTVLCTLPPGDIKRVEVARDDNGYCEAALIFLLGDDGVTQGNDYGEYESPNKYVLCTRTNEGETWKVSEPQEGSSGCFLNYQGCHDQTAVLDSSGKVLSLVAFAGSAQKKALSSSRSRRRIQRIKFENRKLNAVFRSPFAGWNALICHDSESAELCISRNASRQKEQSADQFDHRVIAEDYAIDDEIVMALLEKEVVIDIRWQSLPYGRSGEEYFGAIMTDRRIYFVRDIMQPISRFEFHSIERAAVSFSTPSFSWVGPTVMVVFGNSLISVTVDGRTDRIAGISKGENASVLVAALPDRIIYARPSPDHALNTLSVSSRPFGQISGLMRGVLALHSTGSRYLPNIDEVREVLQSYDVSQGSEELMKILIKNELAPIAYLLLVSEHGKFSISPLRRATLLGRLGDIRQAVSIAELEFGLLPKSDSFHEGTDLYRLLQRLMNMSFANGDFISAQQCSRLLGKKGTLSSFVDVEGGYAAVMSVLSHARAAGDHELVKVLTLVAERSSASTVASDSSLIPSQRELHTIRRAIQAVDMSAIPLGTTDIFKARVRCAPTEDSQAEIDARQTPVELERATPKSISDRLEMINRGVSFEPPKNQGGYLELEAEIDEYDASQTELEMMTRRGTDSAGAGLEKVRDSSDEEDLFDTGGNSGQDASERPEEGAKTTALTEMEAARLTQSIQDQKTRNELGVAEGRDEMWALVEAQHNADGGEEKVPMVRVRDMRERGMRKFGEGRFSTAQRHFESALKTVHRSGLNAFSKPIEIVHDLVYYKLASQVKTAMEEIRTSPHANTAAGRITYLQLATALTSVPMQAQHRLDALVDATDANMIVNNFGSAAQAMHMIKTIGVPEELRLSLRSKYAVCSARGFTDAQPQNLPLQLCFLTLRVLPIGVREFSCNVCPARFLVDSGARVGETCPSCRIGKVGVQRWKAISLQ